MLKVNQKAEKKIDQIKQAEKIKAFKNLLNKQVRDAKKILESIENDKKLSAKARAKTDELVKKILAKSKDKEEDYK